MDIAAARSRLHHETRARLGDVATIRGKIRGEMSVTADPDRVDMTDLKVRFDINPDLEAVGGRERGMALTRFAGRLCTASVPREDLAWLPKKGDQVEVTSRPHEPLFAIVRVADDLLRNIVLYLSNSEPVE